MDEESKDASLAGTESVPEGGRASVVEPKAKKRKKWPMVVGVIAAVVVVAGIGFWTWHEQPSFCNAVCHSPMDNYVNNYYHDGTTLANMHEKANTTCLDCHEANINEQVTEAQHWIAGDFEVDAEGNLATVGVSASKQFCAKSGCHDMTEVIASTQNWGGVEGVNPHDNHQIDIYCSDCHSVHGESNMYCNSCHDWEVPAGWTSPNNQ